MQNELSDADLMARLDALAATGRRTTAELIELLVAVEDRGLHLAAGHSSLFGYCRAALKFSEGEAGNRVAAARAARRFPAVLELLRDGEVNLTTVRLLAPHLTDENHARVLQSARGLDRAGVERLVVTLAPRPVPAPTLRAVPVVAARVDAPAPVLPAPQPKAAVAPLTPEVYRLTATMSAETRELWQRLRELVGGDDAEVLARVVAAALPVIEQRKFAATTEPHAAKPTGEHSRHVPAAIKREVARRDGYRCAFVGTAGRCTERSRLEFHHRHAWMTGGTTTADNLELRCGPHNRHEADRLFEPIRLARVVLERRNV